MPSVGRLGNEDDEPDSMRISRISRLSTCTVLLCALTGTAWGAAAGVAPAVRPWQPEPPPEAVDVAIALDTSGSMELLIDAARLKLWEIVQELTLMEPAPTLRVALLSYGRENPQPATTVRLETDLTTDLTLVSDHLIALAGEGGAQYAPRALQAALEGLDWTASEGALKLILIAGTKPTGQQRGSPVSFREMSAVARREEIFVDDIDTELAELSAAINETFLPLGEQGAKRQQGALEQDRNAEKLGLSVAAGRALAKAGPRYSAGWDLLDAVEAGNVDLYDLEYSELLPERLRGMTAAELELHVEQLGGKRRELRQRIAELGDERRRRIVEQTKADVFDDPRVFDSAERDALRERLAEQGYVVVELMPPDFEPSEVFAAERRSGNKNRSRR